jgi:hemolysin III
MPQSELNDLRPTADMPPPLSWDYDRGETIADGVIHALGLALALGGGAVLVVKAVETASGVHLAAIGIYLVGLLALLGFSAAYNLWPVSPLKWWLRRFDHSAIYLLIAATYTAFLLPLHGLTPAVLLAGVWLAAIAGMAIKLFWPQRFDGTAIVLYLAMGWSGLLALRRIAEAFSPTTLWMIVAGGALYTLGVVFHLWKNLRFQNAIWHGFVLAAAVFHYAAVLTSVTALT